MEDPKEDVKDYYVEETFDESANTLNKYLVKGLQQQNLILKWGEVSTKNNSKKVEEGVFMNKKKGFKVNISYKSIKLSGN